jgi:predicted RNase H-like nuclease (RuvC/YqgF family)
MSQHRRPSSAQTRDDAQRMPFAAAEALLWGKKTHDEHKFLFPRMTELEEQHKAYDTRIAATEVIAEAAEATTARIRRIEQQVAAIESDEQDRPFDRWAEREITSFKSFMEKNKTVRQKQIELETKVLSLEDSADKTKDTSRDIETLLHRIERLENDRVQDANRIKRLEKNINDIVSMSQNQIVGNNQQSIERSPGFYLDQAFQDLPQRGDPGPFYATDETEDEEASPPPRTGQSPSKQAQGHRNPPIILK